MQYDIDPRNRDDHQTGCTAGDATIKRYENQNNSVAVVDAHNEPTNSQASNHATIGVSTDGNPDVRHDGVTIATITRGGPADEAGIKAGDVILAINDHYLFTIRELQDEISHHEPGTKITVHYRRYTSIDEVSVVVGRVQ